ncbi:hypothetical protein H632_c2657p0 [Helicosporidium sp. ATCC 50920]|nr:hypothetical protein H632_c2657p0 [Helicosporidium sp. ATCC 50920]|eukprot:KDD72989.1 hypothetical protein H632_c2657p0 [Helicosporidium sp. ATCC 50920]
MQTASAAVFRKEVAETMLRCETEGVAQENALIELNALKIAEDRTFADCARYMLATALGLAADKVFEGRDRPAEAARGDKLALLRRAVEEIGAWRALLHKFLKSEDDQVELLLTLEEFAGEEGEFESERGGVFADLFAQVLKALYDADIVSEEAVQKWAEEKVHADEDERVFLNKAKPFLDWLAAAEEESEEDSDESD